MTLSSYVQNYKFRSNLFGTPTPPHLFPVFHYPNEYACDASGLSIIGEIDLMEKAMFRTKKDPQVVELEHFRPYFMLALLKT